MSAPQPFDRAVAALREVLRQGPAADASDDAFLDAVERRHELFDSAQLAMSQLTPDRVSARERDEIVRLLQDVAAANRRLEGDARSRRNSLGVELNAPAPEPLAAAGAVAAGAAAAASSARAPYAMPARGGPMLDVRR